MIVEVSAKDILNPNKALMERAREMLEDEEFCEALEKWTARQCATVQGYSEQNRAMLYLQCIDRDLTPRIFTFKHVQLFNGWKARGRAVSRGQRGFVIAARVTAPNPTDENGEPEKDESGKTKKGGMRGFQWLFVFDISQTEPMTEEQITAHQKRQEAPKQSRGKGRKR